MGTRSETYKTVSKVGKTGRESDYDDLVAYSNFQLSSQHVPVGFDDDVLAIDLSRIPDVERVDETALPYTTIDCDDTKDMDDAVAIRRTDGGFVLNVAIADVSHFVPVGSPLERMALARGTSIYLPHETIPMLPPALSEDLCSLKPGCERKAISIRILLGEDAEVAEYSIFKSTVLSRARFGYTQVTNCLKGTMDEGLLPGWERFGFPEMEDLALKLRRRRSAGGAKVERNSDPFVVIDNGSIELKDSPDDRRARIIIEEFMILANSLVADFCIENDLPVILRVQTEEGELASYTTEQTRHASLAVDAYTHFTSPIRRLADLKVHQIVSAHLTGSPLPDLIIEGEYEDDDIDVCQVATSRERRAKSIQLACARYCIAAYFRKHRFEVFRGTVEHLLNGREFLVRLDGFDFCIKGTSCEDFRIGDRLCFRVCADVAKRKSMAYEFAATSAPNPKSASRMPEP